MSIGVLGLNSRTASLAVRERLTKAAAHAFTPPFGYALHDVVVLSTCNRTEIYFSAPDLAEKQSQILSILREFAPIHFEQQLYSLFGSDSFLHLTTVASGLDSVILAETEIQQQVRRAYTVAATLRHLSEPLHFFFQKALKISKAVRSHFALPRGLINLENLLIELALDAEISKVLWIGNSHINRQIMQAFHRRNKFSLTLCTRDVGGARSFAEEREIALIGWEALELWHSWDMIICATRHDEYLIKSCPASKQRLLIDLSMPRLIDPAIAMDRSIHLLNIEELAERVAVRREGLREKMENSKQFLHEAVAASLEAYQKRASRRYAGLLA